MQDNTPYSFDSLTGGKRLLYKPDVMQLSPSPVERIIGLRLESPLDIEQTKGEPPAVHQRRHTCQWGLTADQARQLTGG